MQHRRKIITLSNPEDAAKKMLNFLAKTDAKAERITPKSFKVKVKLDYVSKLLIHINVTETPWGSIVNFSIPNLSYERRVDKTLFGQTVASANVEEKLDKMDSLIDGLKTSFDGLDQDEIRQIVDVQTKLKILTECPRCSSNVKKGWRCAYCKTLMVEFK